MNQIRLLKAAYLLHCTVQQITSNLEAAVIYFLTVSLSQDCMCNSAGQCQVKFSYEIPIKPLAEVVVSSEGSSERGKKFQIYPGGSWENPILQTVGLRSHFIAGCWLETSVCSLPYEYLHKAVHNMVANLLQNEQKRRQERERKSWESQLSVFLHRVSKPSQHLTGACGTRA